MDLKWPAFARVLKKSAVDWYVGWLDFEIMSLVWLVAQATVIFGPPVTFGVYHTLHVLFHTGENLGVRGILQGTKIYFWRAWAWAAVNGVVLTIAAINFIFYQNLQSDLGFVLNGVVLTLLALWLITQYYALPFLMVQGHNSIFRAMRNGFLLALSSPLFTLGIAFFAVIILLLCIVLVLPALIALPLLFMLLSTAAVRDRLQTIGLLEKEVDPKELR